MGFTREELAAMAAADAEIEESFLISEEEREEARLRDRDSSEQLRTHQEVKELQYHREYYYKNRERINAKRREYYRENRERILAQKAKKYAENRDYERKLRHDRRQADPEGLKAYRRDYYRRNREKVLARNKRYRDRAKERRGVSEAERDPKGQR